MAQNQAPSTTSFCVETQLPTSIPVIRFVGGGVLEAQADSTTGTPGTCKLTLDVLTQLQSALAPFQPTLSLLDLVVTSTQCVLLTSQVFSNPTKIPELLECIPGLVAKLNTVLALVPQFPQGIQQFITMIVDVVRFVAQQLDCVITILQSIQDQLDQLSALADQINNVDDPSITAGLQRLFDCGSQEAAQQSSQALAALGPTARILCVIRSLLLLVPGGDEIQSLLQLPDPSSVADLTSAISALEFTRDALLATTDALVALTLGLGVLPPPGPGFVCPLDDNPPSTEEPVTPPRPSISAVTELDGVTPVVLTAPATVDKVALVLGSNFRPSTADPSTDNKVFFGTDPLPGANVVVQSNEVIRITIPAGVLQNTGEFFFVVVNTQVGGLDTPFSGLNGSSVGGENNAGEGVVASDLFQVTVS